MRFLKYAFIGLLGLVLIASAGYLFASSGLETKPGYVKLKTPKVLSATPIVALNLGPRGVGTARWLMHRLVNVSGTDLEASHQALLSTLDDFQGLQLRIYEVNNNQEVFEQAMDESVARLKDQQWQTIVKVREETNRVVVMISEEGDVIAGLSLLVTTPENAVFVNLIGPLNPESIVLLVDALSNG